MSNLFLVLIAIHLITISSVVTMFFAPEESSQYPKEGFEFWVLIILALIPMVSQIFFVIGVTGFKEWMPTKDTQVPKALIYLCNCFLNRNDYDFSLGVIKNNKLNIVITQSEIRTQHGTFYTAHFKKTIDKLRFNKQEDTFKQLTDAYKGA